MAIKIRVSDTRNSRIDEVTVDANHTLWDCSEHTHLHTLIFFVPSPAIDANGKISIKKVSAVEEADFSGQISGKHMSGSYHVHKPDGCDTGKVTYTATRTWKGRHSP